MMAHQQYPDGDFGVPVLFCPLETRRHPLADEMERGFITWMDRLGFAADEHERQTLIDIRGSVFCAGISPEAPRERQQWFTNTLWWYWLLDNKSDAGPSSALTARFVRAAGTVALALAAPCRPDRAPHEDPIVEGAAQLAEQCQQLSTPVTFTRWYQAQHGWIFGTLRQVANIELGIMPDIDEYLSMRLLSSAALATASMLEIVADKEVPAREFNHPRVRALTEMVSMLVALDNDILGYHMEHRTMTNAQNIINVFVHHQRLTPAQSLAEAITLRDTIMLRFLRLSQAPYPGGGSTALADYVQALRRYPRALIDFQHEAPRYRKHFPGGELPVRRVSENTTAPDQPLPYPFVAWWWTV